MKPYFANPEAVARLQFHAGEWLGTPFMPNAAVMGRGVSCQKLIGELYVATGFWTRAQIIPDGPMAWSFAQTESLVEAAVAAVPELVVQPAGSSPAPGDLLGIKIGGCVHHCGLVVSMDGKFIHCLRGPGTVLSDVRDATYQQRIEKIWRPML